MPVPVFQVKITLKGSDPPIWRRLFVSSDTKLSRFHDIIQVVMGWTDSHLHLFKIGDVRFSYPYEPGHLEELTAVDSRYVRLCHLVPLMKLWRGDFHFVFDYEYDFGDGWNHEVVFENVLHQADPTQAIPVCLEGARCCPPEDVGGLGGYQHFLEALGDPEHPEHELFWNGAAASSTRMRSTWTRSTRRCAV
jgi:hypothetical protein